MVVAATGSWQGAHRNHNPLHRSPPCCLPIQGNQACYNRSGCHQKTAKNEVLFSEAAPHHLPSAPSILRTILNRPSRSKGPMNSLPWGDNGKVIKLYILISWVKSVKLTESERLKDWNYIRMRFKDYWHCLKRYVLILGNRGSNVLGLLTSPGPG